MSEAVLCLFLKKYKDTQRTVKTPKQLAQGCTIIPPMMPYYYHNQRGTTLTYKEALTTTYNFTHNTGKKDYNKTEAEMKAYAEACTYLKAMTA